MTMTNKEAIKRIKDFALYHAIRDLPNSAYTVEAFEMAIKALEQTKPCVDTIDALNESIKHFDDMAEECRRNANIERNDYMDMRDDEAEYRQLFIWLNELKWLRERFQSQPEIIHCRDCKHRGEKPIADGRYWCEIHDTFMYYCSDAERRTDE